jgi:hypothetical protein
MGAVSATAALNVALRRGFTLFFDLCFVAVCLVAAMAVSQRDLFTTGVLPPLLLSAVIAALRYRPRAVRRRAGATRP